MWRIPIIYLVETTVLKGILSNTLKGMEKILFPTPIIHQKQNHCGLL